MTSLVFRALDHHVIHGAADHPAFDDGAVQMTYAQLLAQVAAFAGGLAQIGLRDGSSIELRVHGLHEIIAALACARLGAVPEVGATFRIDGDPPVVGSGEHDYPWATVLSAGKTDPAPSPEQDARGYAELMTDAYGSIFATLFIGGTLN